MPSHAESILSRFEERALAAPLEGLAPDVQRALPHLVEAMRGLDRLYLRQLGVLDLAARHGVGDGPEARAFRLFKGPFDRLDEDKPFVAGVAQARPGRAVWPEDLTPEELDAYLAANPGQKDALLDPYTVVVRRDGKLEAVPYPTAYAEDLAPVCAALRRAAAELEHPELKAFVEHRAGALEGKRPLGPSDAEWVRLKLPPLEVVIGPFEVYQDHLRGVKAFYEGMLLVVAPEACARLASIEAGLSDLAAAIPCPAGSRGAVGGMAPLIVADELIATGDGHAGILAAAFNLPNDPEVRGSVGWKQIMIRNVMQAKFDAVSRRIAARAFAPEQASRLSFDAFFHHVLLHEVSHGLGPAYRADGTSVNQACGKAYSPLEEAKADTGGLVLLLELGGRHGLPRFDAEALGVSYLAGLYRAARFGLTEAHGKANVIQYSFHKEQGALKVGADGRVQVDGAVLPRSARALLDRLTTLQAAGTAEEMAAFLDRYGTPPAELVALVKGLGDLPVDILPKWPV